MRITPRQHIQAAKKPKKANPMARARVARQVPQMRKVFKGVTGVAVGGVIRTVGKVLGKKGIKYLKSPEGRKKTKEIMDSPLPKKMIEQLGKLQKTFGKRAGGVIRPKPTFKGKVLKPKPIKDKRGIGIAIRGIGKAFKKGN